MRKYSFRYLITISLVLAVGTISFSAFYIYGNYLAKNLYDEAERNLISTLELVEDQFYYTIDEHDGSVIGSLLTRMNTNDRVVNSYLFNAEGEVIYNFLSDRKDNISVDNEELYSLDEHIEIKSFPDAKPSFSRAYITMHNSATCYECHGTGDKDLGYVVIDLSMEETKDSIHSIRIASLLSTLLMVVVVIVMVIFMHYRFVRKSLKQFHGTINLINQGNLDIRLTIPETKELGALGMNFNEMLDTLQRTQQELQIFHKKELRNRYKLATLGEMSARLAHEIRNPLTGIANATEIIVSETKNPGNIPILEEIQRQAKRANRAINDVLKYSRKVDVNLSMNDINEVIQPVVFFLNNQSHDKEIEVILDLQDDIPLLSFDHEQMEDVLLNLGINATNAIKDKGSITIKTVYKTSDETLFISVTDTGKGIPEEDISKIFHPFFTTRNEGTGLGLAIVKDIVEKHKGEIWAENNENGIGCTFTISLPFSNE